MLDGFTYTDWDATELGVPLAGDVGPYSTIAWHGDDYSQQQVLPAVDGIANYMTYGGRLWLVGWKPVLGLVGSGQYPFTFGPGQFAYDYLRITTGFNQSWFDFPGATGFSGYPDVSVDSAKMYASAHGRLPYVDAFAVRDADTVLRFISFSSDSFQGRPVGVRWLGTSSRAVFFGFPFYYMKEAEARPVAIKVLTDLGEPYGIAESQQPQAYSSRPLPTVVRNILSLPPSLLPPHASLLSVTGRKVLDLHAGANDVHLLAPGVYFVREASARAIHKVVVAR
jgi:hypothetical protein